MNPRALHIALGCFSAAAAAALAFGQAVPEAATVCHILAAVMGSATTLVGYMSPALFGPAAPPLPAPAPPPAA